MRPGLKTVLSLLIATVVFGIFFVIANTGLFSYWETNFYNPQKTHFYARELSVWGEKIAQYHRINLERYGSNLHKDYVLRSFLTNQIQEDIQARDSDYQKLKASYPHFMFCRYVDAEGKKIHFSTLPADIKEKTKTKTVYYTVDQIDDEKIHELIPDNNPLISYSVPSGQIIYSFPLIDNLDILKGYALYYISIQDLKLNLLDLGGASFQDLALIDKIGVIVNFEQQNVPLIEAQIKDFYIGLIDKKVATINLEAGLGGEKYRLFGIKVEPYGFIGLPVSVKNFELGFFVKIILYCAFYLTVFLAAFLLLNLKHDKYLVLADRIKKFQITFIKEFIEARDKIEWNKWKSELTVKTPLVKEQIKRGLGKIKAQEKERIDNLIDKSWQEIIDIFGVKGSSEKTGHHDDWDLSKIEDALKRVLENTQLKTQTIVVAAKPEIVGEGKKPLPVKVEELGNVGIDEVEELDEIVEELEDVDEVTETGSIPEQVLQPSGIKAVDLSVELTEIENDLTNDGNQGDSEEVEDLEEAGEIEEVEEVETAPALKSVAVENQEEEIEEVEDFNELEEIDEGVKQKDAAPEELNAELEELESITEIKALPPEPIEELEYLPFADNIANQKKAGSFFLKALLLKNKIQTPKIAIISFEEFKRIITEIRPAIIEQDGVFQVSNEIYKNEYSQTELKDLADAVLTKSSKKRQVRPGLFFSERGLELDNFFQGAGKADSIMFYSKRMTELTKKINATSMAILKKDEEQKTYVVELALGLNEESRERFRLPIKDDICREYLDTRHILVLNDFVHNMNKMNNNFSQDDLKFIKKAIFVPSSFNDQPTVTFFSFSFIESIVIERIIQGLELSVLK